MVGGSSVAFSFSFCPLLFPATWNATKITAIWHQLRLCKHPRKDGKTLEGSTSPGKVLWKSHRLTLNFLPLGLHVKGKCVSMLLGLFLLFLILLIFQWLCGHTQWCSRSTSVLGLGGFLGRIDGKVGESSGNQLVPGDRTQGLLQAKPKWH